MSEQARDNQHNGGALMKVGAPILAAMAAILIRLPGAAQPIGPDQGILITIGKGITQGRVPYRDVWEMASPGIFYTFALFVKLFGTHMWVPAVSDMIACAISAALIVLLCQRFLGCWVGLWAGLLYAVFSCTNSLSITAGGTTAFGTYWILAQRETFMIPFIVLAVYLHLLVLEKRQLWLLVPYGAAWGMAFLYKVPVGGLIFFAGLHLYYDLCGEPRAAGQKAIRFIVVNALMAIGFIGIQAPFYLAVKAAGGGEAMNDAMFNYVGQIYATSHHSLFHVIKLGIERTALMMRDGFFMWALALAGLVACWTERSRTNLILAGWFFGTVLVVIAHREFHGYHYLLLIPPAAVLAASAMVRAVREGQGTVLSKAANFHPALILIALGFVLNGMVFTAWNYKYVTKSAKYVKGISSTQPGTTERAEVESKYFQQFSAWPEHDFSFPGSYAALRYIEAHSQPTDTFFVYGGIESFMHYLSDRPLASRFIYSWHLFYTERDAVPIAQVYRDEVLASLKANPPRFLVLIGQPSIYEKFADHWAFISGNYHPVADFADERHVYERYDTGGQAQ